MGMADRIRLYMRPFIIRNQVIKTPEKVDQTIKQASRDESNGQALSLMIKFLDRHRRWKYGAHSSDYPLPGNQDGIEIDQDVKESMSLSIRGVQ